MSITFPDDFLWGTSTAAHQTEGGNWNNDWWAWEHAEGTACVEPSGDAVDHLWRYPDDIRLLRELGFGAYRFSLEWSRIEPEAGEFSRAALDHYRRMLATCREHDVVPVVTFHHFTTPRWVAADGGWEDRRTAERFGRFCERAATALGDLIGIGCTINEPNVVTLMGYLVGVFPPGRRGDLAAMGAANDTMLEAHTRAVDALKSGPGDFPVGLTVSMSDWSVPDGHDDVLERVRHSFEGVWLEAARGDDYVGVQAYSRTRLTEQGLPTGPEPGVDTLQMGYEYWPQAVEVATRRAAEVADVPLIITESGIGTLDDDQRIRYTRDVLHGVRRCLDDGLDVRGYFYWSLMDNFEWALGYMPHFGLIAVDRDTQERTVKPSGHWLGEIARTGRVDD